MEESMIDDKPWIETVSGKKFHFLDPQDDEIDIEDIAYALANLCRFNGHCDRFYSVAEHSVFVSSLLPKELQLAGLLHDASEAYLPDVASPYKDNIRVYYPSNQDSNSIISGHTKTFKEVENNLLSMIFKKYNLNYPLSEEVENADRYILYLEQRRFMPDPPQEWGIESFGESYIPCDEHIKRFKTYEGFNFYMNKNLPMEFLKICYKNGIKD